jgi:hypothetical protein
MRSVRSTIGLHKLAAYPKNRAGKQTRVCNITNNTSEAVETKKPFSYLISTQSQSRKSCCIANENILETRRRKIPNRRRVCVVEEAIQNGDRGVRQQFSTWKQLFGRWSQGKRNKVFLQLAEISVEQIEFKRGW